MSKPVRISVLISGNGSNLQALIDAINVSKTVPAEIVLVVSNLSSAYGLRRAHNAGIGTSTHPWKPYKDRPDVDAAKDEFDSELAKIVLNSKPELVFCLGYMRILRPVFLKHMKEAGIEIVNLHPALHGEYNGTKAIERAHAAWLNGETKRTGVMVHRVIEEVDAGEVVVQREIPFVDPQDRDLGVFEDKLHRVEWELVVEAAQKLIAEIRNSP